MDVEECKEKYLYTYNAYKAATEAKLESGEISIETYNRWIASLDANLANQMRLCETKYGVEPSLPFGCSICGAQFHTQEEAREHYEQVHLGEPYVPPEPEPKKCIIATVFLGEDHVLLAPMRKFRDKFLPKLVMDAYYSVSVYVLRKIGRI